MPLSESGPCLTASVPMKNTVASATFEWPCSDPCQGSNSSHQCPASAVQPSAQVLQGQPRDRVKLFSILNVSAPLVFASKHSHKRSLSSRCNTGWTQAKWRVWTHPLICPFVRQKYHSAEMVLTQPSCLRLNLGSHKLLYHYKVAPLWCLLLALWPASSQQCRLEGSHAFLPEELSVMAHAAQVPTCRVLQWLCLPGLKSHNEQFWAFNELTTSAFKIFNSFFFRLWMISLNMMPQHMR